MTTLITTSKEIDDWFSALTDKIDIWVTDPPYPFESQNGTGRYSGMYNRFDWAKMNDFVINMTIHSSDRSRAYLFCNRDGIFKTLELLTKNGWDFRNLLVWDKKAFGGGYHWRNQLEYIVYATKGECDVYVKNLPNIFSYSKPKKSDINLSIGYNPVGVSCKPHHIWNDILLNGTKQDDIFADPFAGSNPGKAAIELNKTLFSKISKAYTNSY